MSFKQGIGNDNEFETGALHRTQPLLCIGLALAWSSCELSPSLLSFQAQEWTFTPDKVTKYLLRAVVLVSWKSPAPASPQSMHYTLRIVGEGALGTIRVRNWDPLGSSRGTGLG